MMLAYQAEFQRYSKQTRCEQFLEEMNAVLPWAELSSLRLYQGALSATPETGEGQLPDTLLAQDLIANLGFLFSNVVSCRSECFDRIDCQCADPAGIQVNDCVGNRIVDFIQDVID
jgi:hypothetical protein